MYRVALTPEAEHFYQNLFYSDKSIFKRIELALRSLSKQPFRGKPLQHRYKGCYSLRVGVYRIIYKVEREKVLVIVVDIGHRRDIYQ